MDYEEEKPLEDEEFKENEEDNLEHADHEDEKGSHDGDAKTRISEKE